MINEIETYKKNSLTNLRHHKKESKNISTKQGGSYTHTWKQRHPTKGTPKQPRHDLIHTKRGTYSCPKPTPPNPLWPVTSHIAHAGKNKISRAPLPMSPLGPGNPKPTTRAVGGRRLNASVETSTRTPRLHQTRLLRVPSTRPPGHAWRNGTAVYFQDGLRA